MQSKENEEGKGKRIGRGRKRGSRGRWESGRGGRDWPEEGGKEGEWEGEWKGEEIRKGFHKIWSTNPGSAEIALLTLIVETKLTVLLLSWLFWRGSHKALVWHKDSASKTRTACQPHARNMGPASGWNKTKVLLSYLWSHWEGAVHQEDISFKITPYLWIKIG